MAGPGPDDPPNNGDGNGKKGTDDVKSEYIVSDDMNTISYEAMEILGLSYEQSLAEGYKPKMMSFNESFEMNQDLLEHKGISKEEYAGIHNRMLAKATAHAKGFPYKPRESQFFNDVTEVELAEAMIAPGALTPMDPSIYGDYSDRYQQYQNADNLKESTIAAVYDANGFLHRTQNKNQEAEAYGFYWDEKGEKQRLDEYEAMDYNGKQFRVDKDGNKKMLVMNSHPQYPGATFYFEQDADEVTKGGIIRSMWGPKEVRKNAFSTMGDNLWNTGLEMTAGSAGTVSEIIGSIVDLYESDGSQSGLTKWGRETQNWSNINKSKITEFAETQGIFDSPTGFFGTFGAIAPQILGGFAVARMFGAGASLLGATATNANKVAKGAGWAFGGMYGASAMNEKAKEMGISDGNRMFMATAAGAIVAASEKILDNMGATGWLETYTKGVNTPAAKTKMIGDAIGKFIPKMADDLAKATTKAGQEKAMITAVKKGVTEAYKNLGIYGKVAKGSKALAKGTVGTAGKLLGGAAFLGSKVLGMGGKGKLARNMTGGGLEEGAEEIIEMWMLAGLEWFHDSWLAEDGSIKGQGLFDPHIPTYDDHKENFWGGFMGGAIGGVLRTFSGYDADKEISNYAFGDLVSRHGTKQGAKAELDKAYQELSHGNPMLTANDELIAALPPEMRLKAESQNDIAYRAALAQLDLAWSAKERLGLNNAEVIAKTMGGDTALLAEAIKLSTDKTYYGSAYEQLKESSKGLEKDTAEGISAEKSLQELKEIGESKSKRLEKILDGSLFAQYQANLFSNAMMFDKVVTGIENKAIKKLKSGKKLKKKEIKEVETILKSTMEVISQDSDFNNQYKAYVNQSTLSNISKQNLEKQAAIAQMRLEDQKALQGDEDVSKELYAIGQEAKNKASTVGSDFNSTISQLQELEKGTEGKGLSIMQAKAANQILENAKKSAVANLGMLDKKNAKQLYKKQSDEDTVPDFSDDYQENHRLLGDQSPFSDDQLKGLEDTINDGTSFTVPEIQAKGFIYGRNAKTVRNDKGQNISTKLLQMVNEDEVASDYYYSVDQDGNIEESDQEDYDNRNTDKFKKENPGVTVFKKTRPDTYRVIAAEATDEYGNPIPQNEVVEKEIFYNGTKMSAEEHALSETIRTSSNGKTYSDHLSEIEEGVREGRIAPTEEISSENSQMIDELEAKISSLELMINMKQFYEQGITISEDIKKALGWQTWGTVKMKQLELNMDMLTGALKQARILQNTIDFLTDNRANQLKRFGEENLKIDANLMNLFTRSFGGKAFYTDKNGIQKEYINPFLAGDLTDNKKDLAKAKQYWHVYFNTTDENGKFINIIGDGTDINDDLKKFIDKNLIGAGDFTGRQEHLGAFTTDTNDFTLEQFKLQYAHQDFGKHTKVYFRESYIFNFLKSVFNQNPLNYYTGYKNSMDQVDNGELIEKFYTAGTKKVAVNPGALNAEQENIMQSLSSHLEGRLRYNDKSTKNAAFRLASDKFHNALYSGVYGGDTAAPSQSHISVLGGAGTGKTMTTNIIMSMAKDKGVNKVVLVAPGKEQLETLQENAKKIGIKYDAYLWDDFYKIKNTAEMKNQFIILDEFSLIKPIELGKTLQGDYKRGEKSKKIDDSNIFYILGDPYQAPPHMGSGTFRIHEYSVTLQNIVAVMRSGFVDISNMQNLFKVEIIMNENSEPVIKNQTYYDKKSDKGYRGVQVFNTVKAFDDVATDRVNNHGATLIVFNQEDVEIARADEKYKSNASIKTIADIKNSPQGKEYDEVYVYIPMGEDEAIMGDLRNETGADPDRANLNKYMLTAVSRPKQFLGIYMQGKPSIVKEDGVLQESKLDPADIKKGKIERFKEVTDIIEGLIDDIENTVSKATVKGKKLQSNQSSLAIQIIPPTPKQNVVIKNSNGTTVHNKNNNASQEESKDAIDIIEELIVEAERVSDMAEVSRLEGMLVSIVEDMDAAEAYFNQQQADNQEKNEENTEKETTIEEEIESLENGIQVLNGYIDEAIAEKDSLELEAQEVVEQIVEAEGVVSTLLQMDEDTDEMSAFLAKIEEVKRNKSFIKGLTKDGSIVEVDSGEDFDHYVKVEKGSIVNKYTRVSKFIGKGDLDKTIPNIAAALTMGNIVDEFVRDFFEGTLDLSAYKDNSGKKVLADFIYSLTKLRDKMVARGETILANGIVLYNDELNVAGTVDIITYDERGNIRIYDMKTMKGNHFTEHYGNQKKNKYETEEYGKSKKQQYQEQLSLYRILLYNTHRLAAIDLEIIPIELMYNAEEVVAGKIKTSRMKLLPNVAIEPMDNVYGATMAEDTVEDTVEDALE